MVNSPFTFLALNFAGQSQVHNEFVPNSSLSSANPINLFVLGNNSHRKFVNKLKEVIGIFAFC